MRPLYIVVEEVWSISSKPDGRRRLSTSERPLFSGGTKRVAYAHARELASKFQFYGVHEEGDELYWWGRNEIDSVNRRFVIEPGHRPPRSRRIPQSRSRLRRFDQGEKRSQRRVGRGNRARDVPRSLRQALQQPPDLC
jgi:hypothetical protein